MEKYLDVRKIFEEKNPELLRKLPAFVIRYIEKIAHQDELNLILHENRKLQGIDFCREVVQRFSLQLSSTGIENVPRQGGVILAANHPLGGMDAIAIVDQLAKHRPDIRFIVNDILLRLENLKDLFIGVNKHGATAMQSLQRVEALFGSGEAIVIFPSGMVSRKFSGEAEDPEWKKTFVSRARKYQIPIVPVFIDGRLSSFFYRLHRLRTFLGIRSNVEMLYLVNELFKQKGRSIPIHFGHAVQPEELADRRSDLQWAAEIRRRVYDLKAH